MGNLFKALLALGVVAGGAAAVMAYKKRKELEDYDYEDLDDDFDDCIDDTTPEEDLDKVEEPVEDVDLADKVGEAAEDAADKVSDVAEELADKAEESVENLEDKVDELKDSFFGDDE